MLSSVTYQYFLLFFVTRIVYGQLSCSCNLPNSNFAKGVNLLYYKCNEIRETIAYPITAPHKLLNMLDDNKRTIFYIFGYSQYPNKPNVVPMTDALCYGQMDNVVVVDWSKYSNSSLQDYSKVFRNAEKVGRLFAESIRLLVHSGLDKLKIYIVGNSLGAHIAGFAGKCNVFTIPRITALDPANPIFYPLGCYLAQNDTAWLDAYHTDINGYGTSKCIGTVDYFVNGGSRFQPGCSSNSTPGNDQDFCSHQKAVELYVNSKTQSIRLPVKKCFDLACRMYDCRNKTWMCTGEIQLMSIGYISEYR